MVRQIPMPAVVTVSGEIIKKVMGYLGAKPFVEVAQLIDELGREIQETIDTNMSGHPVNPNAEDVTETASENQLKDINK